MFIGRKFTFIKHRKELIGHTNFPYKNVNNKTKKMIIEQKLKRKTEKSKRIRKYNKTVWSD